MSEVTPVDPRVVVRQFRREVSRELRAQGRAVVREVKRSVKKGRTGNLRRNIKMRVKFDADGPYVRITTSARRKSKNSSFRYGLALQQREHYLQKGLARTPRR